MPIRIVALLICSSLNGFSQRLDIPLFHRVSDERNLNFSGKLSVEVTGTNLNALFDWSLEIKNNTTVWIKEIEFCILFLDQKGERILDQQGRGCLVRMRRYNVGRDDVVTGRGKQTRIIKALNTPFKIYGAELTILDLDMGDYEARTGFKRTAETRDIFDKERLADEASRRRSEARMKELSVATPAPEPEERAAGRSEVSMTIYSEPHGAEIFIDGESRGNAPALVKVRLGGRRIELKKSGYVTYARYITIREGEALNIKAEMEKIE